MKITKGLIWVFVATATLIIFGMFGFCRKRERLVDDLVLIKAAIAKSGEEAAINAEADHALSRFSGDSLKFFTEGEVNNMPSIKKLSEELHGEILGIWPAGADGAGIPAHVRIRFGDHFSYRFILLSGNSSISRSLDHVQIRAVGKGIYCKSPTKN